MVTPRSQVVLALALSSLLVACEGNAPEPVVSEPSADPAAQGAADTPVTGATVAAFPEPSRLVEIPVDTGARAPLFLAQDESLIVEIAAPESGTIQAVGIEIGNFEGASEGAVRIEACQLGTCAEGQAPLGGSTDNAYLPVTLAMPLPVQGDQPLVVTVSRAIGYNPFAVWAYPATTTLTLPDGSEASQSLKLVLSYQDE